MPSGEEWDLFISHASEDKEPFVKPLADLLAQLGVKVWYDQFALQVGDSVSRSIDRGLAQSRFGLVVISRAFIAKKWPEYELRGLTALELAQVGKRILPVWHNVTHQEVLDYSPSLADKFALNSSQLSINEIAIKVLQQVRPDSYRLLVSRAVFRQVLERSHQELVPISSLIQSPIRHQQLPRHLLIRIKLAWRALEDVLPMSLEEMVITFHRDVNPADEVARWETIAAAYLDMVAGTQLALAQKKEIFDVLLRVFSGGLDTVNFTRLTYVTPNMLRRAIENLVPKVTLPTEDTVATNDAAPVTRRKGRASTSASARGKSPSGNRPRVP